METEKVKTKVSFVKVFTITLYAYLTVTLLSGISFAIFKAVSSHNAETEQRVELKEAEELMRTRWNL